MAFVLYEWRFALAVPDLDGVRERLEQRTGLAAVFSRRDREGDSAILAVPILDDEATLQRGPGRIVVESRRTPTRYFAWQLAGALLDLGGLRFLPHGAPDPPKIAALAARKWPELGFFERLASRVRVRV
jgi:hypothetical protein